MKFQFLRNILSSRINKILLKGFEQTQVLFCILIFISYDRYKGLANFFFAVFVFGWIWHFLTTLLTPTDSAPAATTQHSEPAMDLKVRTIIYVIVLLCLIWLLILI